ncbi:MAG TPA: hypothetical protein VFR39_07480 [Burkholderiales bacterium]|nr:hypothetical protein [Burkholderiales bacterium]
MNWKKIAAAMALCSATGTAGAVGGIADVTVYDRAENRTLPVYRHDGRYYVVGRPGNEYQIRVSNRTGAEILTVVSVDGVNAVSGETADWSQTGYVLGRHQSYDIKGWRKSEQRVAAFYFTEHQNSYAARTGRPDNVGVIGVAVFRKKAEPEARIEQYRRWHDAPASGSREDSSYSAPDDTLAGAGSARSAERAAGPRHAPSPQAAQKSTVLGTGHGRSESSHVTYTSFERATDHPAQVIAIHYNTYANLVAMGVIRAPKVASPTPFPGQFVPDPR